MTVERQVRHVGDTLVAIAASLKRPDGTAVDLSDLTVKFKMKDAQGNVKVALTETNVTVTDAEAGECQYDPQAADVDTAGTFYAYFVTEDAAGNKDTFPARTGDFEVIIMPNV